MTLTTLDRIKDEMRGIEAYKGALDEQRLMNYARTVTKRAQGYGWLFEPRYQIRKITPTPRNVNSRRGLLTLDMDLLEVFSIVVGSVTPTYGTDIVSEPDDGQSPIHTLRIVNINGGPLSSWYAPVPPINNFADSIVITGLWGMRTEYLSRGFFDSGINCPALTAGQTSFVVTDVAGPDVYGRVPLFSAGNLLRIENELIEVTAVNTTTKTLSVYRGVNGSIAAAHNIGTDIKLWEPEDDITQIVTRQACLLYARRGAYQAIALPDGTSIVYPSDLLAELRATVNRFSYVRT